MENYLVVLAAAGAAAAVIGGGYAVYQLFRLAETDARCRGMKHPRLWGLLASSGSNQSGLLLYLIGRRNHPVLSLSEEEKGLIQRRKRKIGVGIAFLVAGAGDVKLRQGGVLADIAPTMLKVMGLPQPEEMTGKSIIE